MFTYPESPASGDDPADVGPPPYLHRADCHICRRQDGLKTGSALLDGPHPDAYIVEDEHYIVDHAPLKAAGAGTVIVQTRRHMLDFADMTPIETAAFGSLLHRLVPAVKAATGVERVYYLSLMERSAHFHMWLVPKNEEGDLLGVDYLAQQPPLTASLTEAETMSQRIRDAIQTS